MGLSGSRIAEKGACPNLLFVERLRRQKALQKQKTKYGNYFGQGYCLAQQGKKF